MVLDLWVMDGVVVSRDSRRASGYYQKHHYQCNIYYFCKVWIKHVFEFVVVLLLWLIDQRYKGRSQKKLDFFISFIRKHPFSYMRASLKKEMKVIDFSNRYLDWWVISIKEREWEKQCNVGWTTFWQGAPSLRLGCQQQCQEGTIVVDENHTHGDDEAVGGLDS